MNALLSARGGAIPDSRAGTRSPWTGPAQSRRGIVPGSAPKAASPPEPPAPCAASINLDAACAARILGARVSGPPGRVGATRAHRAALGILMERQRSTSRAPSRLLREQSRIDSRELIALAAAHRLRSQSRGRPLTPSPSLA